MSPLPARRQQAEVIRVRTIIRRSLNFNILLFPGVVFHELAHFIASVMFGAKVTKANFWGVKEANIVHEEAGGDAG